MKLLFVACSIQAYELMGRIREKWQQAHPEDLLYNLVKCSALPDVTEKRSLTVCIGEWFYKGRCHCFPVCYRDCSTLYSAIYHP